MREWSDEVRELGNDATHPDANSEGTYAADARDVVGFSTIFSRISTTYPRLSETIANGDNLAGNSLTLPFGWVNIQRR
jgi:hypothetical protein